MKYAELRRLCDESLAGISEDIIDNILSGMDEDEEFDIEDIECRIDEELDSYFTYYSDAWEYLQDNNITDFEDAFYEWNATGICSIACYYAHGEVCSELEYYWDEYEDTEGEDEEDEYEDTEGEAEEDE